MDEQALGTLLRQYREQRGLTQEDLAEKAGHGLSVSTISNIERGRTRPYRHTIEALCVAMALGPSERDELLATRRSAPYSSPRTLIAPPTPRSEALPTPLTPLIGREREVAEVARLTQRVDVRLLTVTGVGGVGKTRLAQEVASHLPGTVIVSLAAVSDPALLLPALARALGVRETGHEDLRESLIAHLQENTLLLFLDNFEQIVAAGADLAELLGACPGVTALVTSRTALRVRGEQEYPLVPLALPLPSSSQMVDLDALAQTAAVALFVQRVQAIRPEFELSPANAADVAAICACLDGLPLAIELAAARSKLFPPQVLLQRLDRRLALLTGGAKDLPGRQQTLRAAIDWSYSLLSPSEQTVFARLSVFVGGCDFDAAEAVCNADGELDLLAGISGLVEHSLVRLEGEDEPRSAMLETIREYATERLEARGELSQLRRQHAQHFLCLAEQAEPNLTGPEQGAWLVRLDREHDNLRAALGWSLAMEPELALRLVSALWWFWRKRGHLSEGQRWAEEALACGAEAPEQSRARAMTVAGFLAYLRYDPERAVAWEEKSLAISRRLGDARGIAMALFGLANIAIMRGDDAIAEAQYREILELEREAGRRWEIAGALNNLGYVLEKRHELEEAEQRAADGLALFRELGDLQGAAWTLMTRGSIARKAGHLDTARGHLEEALTLAREIGDRVGITQMLADLALVRCEQGDVEQAKLLLDESLDLARLLGHGASVAIALLGLAKVAEARNDDARAYTLYAECLELCRTGADHVRMVESLVGMAGLAVKAGAPLRTARLLGAAARVGGSGPSPRNIIGHAAYDQIEEAARAALGDERFLAAGEASRNLDVAAAIACALAEE